MHRGLVNVADLRLPIEAENSQEAIHRLLLAPSSSFKALEIEQIYTLCSFPPMYSLQFMFTDLKVEHKSDMHNHGVNGT